MRQENNNPPDDKAIHHAGSRLGITVAATVLFAFGVFIVHVFGVTIVYLSIPSRELKNCAGPLTFLFIVPIFFLGCIFILRSSTLSRKIGWSSPRFLLMSLPVVVIVYSVVSLLIYFHDSSIGINTPFWTIVGRWFQLP